MPSPTGRHPPPTGPSTQTCRPPRQQVPHQPLPRPRGPRERRPRLQAPPLRSRDTLLMAQAPAHPGRRRRGRRGRRLAGHPGRLRGGGEVDCGLAGSIMRASSRPWRLAWTGPGFDGDEHARLRPMARCSTPCAPRRGRRGRGPGRRLPLHRAGTRLGARRSGDPRRVGVLAVRLRAAAVGAPASTRASPCATRRARRPEPAAHRDDGRDPARRRCRRRRRRRPRWRVEPSGINASTCSSARPLQRRASSSLRRSSRVARCTCRAGPQYHDPGEGPARAPRHDGRGGPARPDGLTVTAGDGIGGIDVDLQT